MVKVDPREYQLEFFREMGFERRVGRRCREAFWTLNPEFEEPQDTPCVDYWFRDVPSREPLRVGEARRLFLGFFERRGHRVVEPRPVVARWREDLYLTIASIVVFQPHVTSGLVPPPANPLVISQPSVRLEDIDNVGLTIGRHLTSFEMAAHHAFNYPDRRVYWKEETVRYAFEFFTKELGIPGDMIIFKESWWEGGGNAGPSFEVAVGGLELATLVFMMYRVDDGSYKEIPLKIVDTGYGVERISWFTQKTPTAFHAIYGELVDRFRDMLGLEKPDESLLWAAYRAAGNLEPEDPASVEEYYGRVSSLAGMDLGEVKAALAREARLYSILDHTRTLALMLADGIVPSNSGEGYLARLVARRTLRQMRYMPQQPGLEDLVGMQIEFWKGDFPRLKENESYILEAAGLEEARFRDLIRRGAQMVRREVRRKRSIGLSDLITFYDTHGMPPEMVAEIASSEGVKVEVPHNFYSIVAARHRSPGRVKGYGFEKVELPSDIARWAAGFPETRRIFHEDPYARTHRARVLGGQGRYLVFDSTLFYPTGGGQIHDTGFIVVRGRRYRIVDVQNVGGVIVHVAEEEVDAEPGDEVYMELDWERRYSIMKHHTATHVLISAARRVLGSHVWQAGAEKTEFKGRLDITHHKPLSRDEVRRIEGEVNRVIRERRRVWEEMVEKNVAEEKYGFAIYQGGVPMEKKIRLVFVEGWDVEACFGTHVRNTGEIGGFKIISATRIQDGVVRLEYVAGERVAEYASSLEDRLDEIAKALGAPRGMEVERVRSAVELLKETQKTLRGYRRMWAETLRKLVESASPVGGVRILVAESPEPDRRGVQEVLSLVTGAAKDSLLALAIRGDEWTQIEIAAGEDAARIIDVPGLARSLASRLSGRGGGKRSYASVRIPGKPGLEEIEEIIRELVAGARG